jgi:hypothetical protein
LTRHFIVEVQIQPPINADAPGGLAILAILALIAGALAGKVMQHQQLTGVWGGEVNIFAALEDNKLVFGQRPAAAIERGLAHFNP